MLLTDDLPELEAGAQSDSLAALVEKAFPSLHLGNRRLEQSGGDHILLIVDDHFAFRFPRTGMHGLNLELAVLQRLQCQSILATPSYQYIDPEGRFAGYPLIKGTELTPARFAALSSAQQRDVLLTAALFLTELHSLSAEQIASANEWPFASTAADSANRGLRYYLPALRSLRLPEQALSLETFYTRNRDVAVPQPVVIHGDLVFEHVLLDEKAEQLSGIIDFGDVALGDPAQDFLGFWAYGAEAARIAVELYQPAGADSGFLARSRDHFVRYRLDRIFEGVNGNGFDPAMAAAKINALPLA